MTAFDTMPPPAALRVPVRDTGLRVPQIMLTTLFASAGFNMLLALQQQVTEHFTRLGVGEWVRYVAAATYPVFPT